MVYFWRFFKDKDIIPAHGIWGSESFKNPRLIFLDAFIFLCQRASFSTCLASTAVKLLSQMLTEALVRGFVSTFQHMCLCVRINLRVVSDPLRASLASFAYTANTASWYSVSELRCCNTTEVSLPSTTAWSPGAQVV